MIETYEALVTLVDELGFLPLSQQLDPRLPSLTHITPGSLWHTGLDSDPWTWKNRAAYERRLAYGCILNGFKGFIAPRLYPAFYAAFHDSDPDERWADGTLDQAAWQLWQLFGDQDIISTADSRTLLPGIKTARIDSALIKLQRSFDITLCGSTRKVNKQGEPYGWSINTYRRVSGWLDDWCGDMAPEAARETILRQTQANDGDVDVMRAQLGWL